MGVNDIDLYYSLVGATIVENFVVSDVTSMKFGIDSVLINVSMLLLICKYFGNIEL